MDGGMGPPRWPGVEPPPPAPRVHPMGPWLQGVLAGIAFGAGFGPLLERAWPDYGILLLIALSLVVSVVTHFVFGRRMNRWEKALIAHIQRQPWHIARKEPPHGDD